MCSSSPDLGPVLCEVPCSRDCVLSDWTSWSTCSQTCSSKTMEGKQMRMRSILAYNAGEGVSTAALPIKFCLIFFYYALDAFGHILRLVLISSALDSEPPAATIFLIKALGEDIGQQLNQHGAHSAQPGVEVNYSQLFETGDQRNQAVSSNTTR